MCLQYWQQNGRPLRRRFVALSNAFHGETLTATALGGVDVFRKPFLGVLLDCVHVEMNERGMQTLDELLRAEGDTIAG